MRQVPALTAFALLIAMSQPGRSAAPIKVVAAENFYGDVAQQIGGADVAVTSILSNPDQDPHLFEASASVAREVASARFVVYSGIDYDPWMQKLLGAARSPNREVIVVAPLIGRKPGDNPHVWYDPAAMLALGSALADDLRKVDPAHQAGYQQRLARFRQSIQRVTARIAGLRARLKGSSVTATEPVFGYMFEALGMQVRNQPFQLAVMNNTEPSASSIAAFEDDLRKHRVRLLLYNSQATDPIAERMETLAKASHVPVLGATETEPHGIRYQAWMLSELDALDHALPN